MTTQRSLFVLFTIIILEGYVVLSSELLAIRLSMPFVGSGTDTVSIIIAAVLMPMAFGYRAGGRFKPGRQKPLFGAERYISVREKLISNMLIALAFLLFGLSYSFLDGFFMGLIKAGLVNRIMLTTLYAGLFIAAPVYLLAQTIPLTCNFFSRQRLAKITGRILFLSTLGSFLGAILSTLVLMNHIGVHNTAIVNFVVLGTLITLLSKQVFTTRIALVWALVMAGTITNTDAAMRRMNIVENNQYNTIKVFEDKGQRHLLINGNGSSLYSEDGRKHHYIEFIEQIALNPIILSETPKNILVLGAGGFTLGIDDKTNLYDFVDIDASLKNIAEERILKRQLTDNKTFHPMPARAFLMQSKQAYDVIVLDVFSGAMTMPDHLVTQEFFQQVKERLKPGGKIVANMALAPGFSSPISRNIDNTLRSVFPHVSRHVIGKNYGLWNENKSQINNVIYIYRHHEGEEDGAIYTDTKNRASLDRPANLR